MGKTYNYALLASTLALSTNFGLRRITLTVQSILCIRISLHVNRIEARYYDKKMGRTDGNELFEKILWGIVAVVVVAVVVVVRRHGYCEDTVHIIHPLLPSNRHHPTMTSHSLLHF